MSGYRWSGVKPKKKVKRKHRAPKAMVPREEVVSVVLAKKPELAEADYMGIGILRAIAENA